MPFVLITCEACGATVRVMQKPSKPPIRFCSRECSRTRYGRAAALDRLAAIDAINPAQPLWQFYIDQKLGIGTIAKRLRVGHKTIRGLLIEFGIPQRSIAEQKAIDLDRMAYADRLAMTAASRAIITGKKRSHEDLCKRAKGKQHNAKVSGDEAEILAAMNAAGLHPIPLFAVDKYNIDFAFPALMLGIEYNGGNWHNTPAKIEGDARKLAFLESEGWSILVFPRLARARRQRDSGNARIELAELVRQVAEHVLSLT